MRYLVVLLLLGGCASTSDVMELGRDRYMVSATMGGQFPEWDEVKGMAVKRAAEHCAGDGKRLEAGEWKTSGARGWSRLRAELQFRCVEK